MTTEYQDIGFYGRANKAEQEILVKKNYQKYDYTWVWWTVLGIFLVSGLLWLLVGFLVPPSARAEQTGPRNNKEACQDAKAGKYLLPVGHVSELVKLCSKYGISI